MGAVEQRPGLKVTRNGRVTVLTLDRPEVRHALDKEMLTGLTDEINAATAQRTTGAIVLTSTGNRSFCAGMDLALVASGDAELPSLIEDFEQALWSPDRAPIVAAVAGDAIGGGFEILLLCDLVVAGDHVQFGLPEVTRGLVPGGGATLLPARLPHALATELALVGAPISASRAHQMGLVNRVVAPGQELAGALELAQQVAANGPHAVATTRSLLAVTYDEGAAAGRAALRQRVRGPEERAEAAEGMAAFFAKRAPNW